MLKRLICKTSTSLMDVMRLIDTNERGIAFVVDKNQKLSGVITDGDLRRLILNDHALTEPVGDNICENYVFARITESTEEMIKRTNRFIRILPVVNERHEVVDYFEYQNRIHVPVAKPDILAGNELRYLTDALLSTWISSSGYYIDTFEKEFSSYCETSFGVACSNGTVALQLALAALEIGPGDEVIVPDLTFAATINTVIHAGATPVIVDIEEHSWCIDPKEVEKAITDKTKAIIPVHLFGQPCDMDPINKLAKKHNLRVIEDSAQAHGARYKGKRVGGLSDIGCFSFFGNKVITTGEGGMCVTNDPKLDERMRVLRDHGMSKSRRYWHEYVGFNGRMTNMQAAIGCAQLEKIDSIHKRRRELEKQYREQFEDVTELEFQAIDLPNRDRITWLVCALVKEGKREDWIARFKDKGMDVRPFFFPLSAQDLYKNYTFSNTISTKVAAQGINLPTVHSLDVGDLRKQLDLEK